MNWDGFTANGELLRDRRHGLAKVGAAVVVREVGPGAADQFQGARVATGVTQGPDQRGQVALARCAQRVETVAVPHQPPQQGPVHALAAEPEPGPSGRNALGSRYTSSKWKNSP